MVENRPNFEIIQTGDDEFELITRDGSIHSVLTREQMEELRDSMDNPLPLDLSGVSGETACEVTNSDADGDQG